MVGGGPTGVEFSGELSDFIMKDVRQRYSHVKDDIRVTLIEVFLAYNFIDKNYYIYDLFHKYEILSIVSFQARDILSSFDDRLRHYAIKQLNKVIIVNPYANFICFKLREFGF